MNIFNTLLAFVGLAQAHYNFPSTIYDGTTSAAWSDVRQWTGYYTYDPVVNVSIVDIRCNVNGSTTFAASILSVAAGSSLGFTVNPDIYHPGPLLAYMAKVPSGYTAANWDGSGSVCRCWESASSPIQPVSLHKHILECNLFKICRKLLTLGSLRVQDLRGRTSLWNSSFDVAIKRYDRRLICQVPLSMFPSNSAY